MALTDRAIISWDCGPKNRAGQGGKATTRGSCVRLTSGNIAATDTAESTWQTAASTLSKAQVDRYAIDHGTNINPSPLTAPLNKGEKWVVTMQESSGNARIFTHTIPAADESGTRVLPNTLNANLADSNWAAYKTAAEAFLTTPDGNAMGLISATILTRRR